MKKRTTMPNMTLFITMRHTHCRVLFILITSFFSFIFGNSCESHIRRTVKNCNYYLPSTKKRVDCYVDCGHNELCVCVQITLIFVLLQDMRMRCTSNNERWHRLVSAYWMNRKPYLTSWKQYPFHDNSIFFNRGNYKANKKHAVIVLHSQSNNNSICKRDERDLLRRALDECAIWSRRKKNQLIHLVYFLLCFYNHYRLSARLTQLYSQCVYVCTDDLSVDQGINRLNLLKFVEAENEKKRRQRK